MQTSLQAAFATLSVVGMIAAPSQAQVLKAGSPAPKIQIAEWLKGAPVSAFKKGEVYVIEFWATWCGPCRENMPHLTELQKKYPKAKILGISVLEPDTKQVKPFVAKMGTKMGYTIGREVVTQGKGRDEGTMNQTWLKPAGQNGIPVAFVVDRQSKIAWIGHPMYLERPLKAVLDGSWKYEMAALPPPEEAEMQQLSQKFMQLRTDGKATEALQVFERLSKLNPMANKMFGIDRVILLHQVGKLAEAEKALKTVLDGMTSPMDLAVAAMMGGERTAPVGWTDRARTLFLARLDAFEAAGEGKDALSSYGIAYFYNELGSPDKARAIAERALKDPALLPNMKPALEKMLH
ncbi:redoxin family protein [Armatimonas rosea]|uniref:Thiol-disulfide isomerase/thioredoxin n=1 Tax=Armatimonas rosea TaxID=685828 RepID=A0A7W9W7A9_ARMRO|nr:redoxin family protein [Armatimonas rosea]MBB6051453.1 thiol-disulfide isomerase/thioredoxin [Armatimonas rosea]